jgi:hypothetical protein
MTPPNDNLQTQKLKTLWIYTLPPPPSSLNEFHDRLIQLKGALTELEGLVRLTS